VTVGKVLTKQLTMGQFFYYNFHIYSMILPVTLYRCYDPLIDELNLES
jgi:hypothetical protein